MLSRTIPRLTRLIGCRNSSGGSNTAELLRRIINIEQGIYEPEVQKDVKLDQRKSYIAPMDTKLLSLTGIHSKPEVAPLYEDIYSQHNDVGIFKYDLSNNTG